jgi:hypothetical protein
MSSPDTPGQYGRSTKRTKKKEQVTDTPFLEKLSKIINQFCLVE